MRSIIATRWCKRRLPAFGVSMEQHALFGQVAVELCLTPKSLARYFHQFVGMEPKRCAQLLRLKRTLPAYRQIPCPLVSEEMGYADFTHFARASRRLSSRPLPEL